MTKEQISKLNEPLDRNHVRQREQSGVTLDYVDGYYVTARMNEVFDGDWSRETEILNQVQTELKEPTQEGRQPLWYVSYTAKCTLTVAGVTRQGVGYGQGTDRDLGKAHESAIKEAETDAFKRAAMTLGMSMGLALYDKTQANVTGTRSAASVRAQSPARTQQRTRTVSNGNGYRPIEDGKWGEFQALCRDNGITPTDALKIGEQQNIQGIAGFAEFFSKAVAS